MIKKLLLSPFVGITIARYVLPPKDVIFDDNTSNVILSKLRRFDLIFFDYLNYETIDKNNAAKYEYTSIHWRRLNIKYFL